jgi:hypothetical protein
MISAARSLRVTAFLTGFVAVAACGGDDGPTQTGPLPPTNVAASANSSTSIRISFDAPPSGALIIVERAPASGDFVAIDTVGTSSFEDVGLTPGTQYRYRLATLRGTSKSAYTAVQTITTLATGAQGQVVLDDDIQVNRRLDRDTVYVLKGFIRVANGATLTIEDGTKIVGDTLVPGSALFVLRGARIEAAGTAQNPIVFTSQRAPGNRKPGDWGGLIIVGNGCINRSGTVIVEGSNATIEGAPQTGINYGGNVASPCPAANVNDNSGTLRYVRVEFAGYAVASAQELNSFTFAAVGGGTTIDHLQSVAGLDDAYEWFGGAVNGKYLVSYESGDDHFDASEGYTGKNQFLIGLQTTLIPPAAGTGGIGDDPQGFEVDGCSGTGCVAPAGGNSQSSEPYNMPVFANFTMVGTGDINQTSTSGGVGMVLRRGTGGTYINGVVARWPRRGISVRDTTTFNREAVDSLIVSNILLAENAGGNFDSTGTKTRLGDAGFEESAATAGSLFLALPAVGTAPTVATLDWTPAAGSAAATGGMNAFTGPTQARAGTFVTPTPYRGAAAPGGPKWWEGWTVYYRN